MSSVPARRLEALTATVANLAARVELLEAALARRSRRDPDADARLLAAIALVFGETVFSVADVQASDDAEVRAAVRGIDGRTLGAILRRIRAHPVAPYALERIGRDGDGALWSLYVRPTYRA